MAKEPAHLEYFVAKGEDVVFPMVHTISADDPTAVDITGWTISAVIGKADGSTVATINASLTDAVNGKYSWTITHAQSNIAVGVYGLTIWRTNPNSERALMIGTLEIGRNAKYP